MYLVYNTLTQEHDECETWNDAINQHEATQEWLKEQRAYNHHVIIFEAVKTDIVKEDVS